jgi:hypothetical protein
VTNQNVKYAAQSSTAKKVLARNVTQFVRNQRATPSAQIQHQLVNQFVKNHFAIGNVIAQLTAKNQNALLSVKNHHIVNHKHHQPIAANPKNQQPNVVNVKKLQVVAGMLEILEMQLHLVAKLWSFNVQAIVLLKLMQKKHLVKLPARNLHPSANSVVRSVGEVFSY